MKTVRISLAHLLASVFLSACISAAPTPSATATLIAASPTSTPSPTLAQTATWTPLAETATPPATLSAAEAGAKLRTLLREPIDCAAPCFWGITPGQTALNEAKKIFAQLGLYGIAGTTLGNRPAYGTRYDFDDGLWINPVLIIEGNLIKGSEINLHPEKEESGMPREWLAYSPETLIRRYGPPSKVEFSLDKAIGSSKTQYYMLMYFDAVDMVAEYESVFDWRGSSFTACPLTDQFRFVTLWMAEAPQDQPNMRTPLQTATPMSMDEFAALMTGDPAQACLELKR